MDLTSTHASFCIYADDLDPGEWTLLFGCQPHYAARTGDEIPSGQGGRAVRQPTGAWIVSSEGVIRSDDLTDHVRHLVNTLGLRRPGISAVLKRPGLKVRFLCFRFGEKAIQGTDAPPGAQALADEIGIELEIDSY